MLLLKWSKIVWSKRSRYFLGTFQHILEKSLKIPKGQSESVYAFCHVHKLLFAWLTDNIHHIVFLLLNCRSRKKIILDRQHIAGQWGLQLIFRMHNSDPNRNILLWFKCVLTALHVNCMILFDKVLSLEQKKMYTWVK